MSKVIYKLEKKEFPSLLGEIPDPPKELYIRGKFPDEGKYKFLCVVGSRKYSNYGKEALEKLIEQMRGAPVVIVSGLAIGIDSIAHSAAIKHGLKTVAIPGSGLGDAVLYPRTNVNLAKRILDSGGALVSEFEPDFKATPWSFPQRNRIMAGVSHAVLVVEATDRSGTLITSRLASEYNRDVMAIPGSIFSKSSFGPHMLIEKGAIPVTSGDDILDALDITSEESTGANLEKIFDSLPENERRVINLLDTPISRDELISMSDLPIQRLNIILSSLEIKGAIEEKMGKIRIK